MNDDTVIELEGVNGEWFTLSGPDAGAQGFYLGVGPKGLFEPAVKTTYEEPGNFPGSRFLNYRVLRRDIVLPILIEGTGDYWAGRDGGLRKALAYDKDAYIHITTPESGHRKLKVRLGGQDASGPAIDIEFDIDPHMPGVNLAKVSLIAGDPFWYQDDVVYSVVTQADTTFQPTIFEGLFNFWWQPQEYLAITVDPVDGKGGLNPTDMYVAPKWIVPGSQEAIPGITIPIVDITVNVPWDEAPFSQFSIPDYSFEDPSMANRNVVTPGLLIGEDCVIDTDPRVEQFSAANGGQVWARTNGVRFLNQIPPYTKSKTFYLIASGCRPGQMITLRIPRPWSRPWGLE